MFSLGIFLCLIVSIYADFSRFQEPAFQPMPFVFGSQQIFDQSVFQNQNQIGGNAAAAGNANVLGQGTVSSINQANHQADAKRTQASSLSANTGSGDSPTVNGAAQAGGTIVGQHQVMRNSGQQNVIGRPPTGSGGIISGGQGAQQVIGQSQIQKQKSATGNAAAAGNTGAKGQGTATSINQANHQATDSMTSSNGLSANTATGEGASAGGAAQAGGTVQGIEQGRKQVQGFNQFQFPNGR